MRILLNESFPVRSRSISGIPFTDTYGSRFLLTQSHNGTHSGQPLLSSTLFLDRGPNHDLVHIYTTFWSHDGTETYFGLMFLMDGLGLMPEVECRNVYVPDENSCWFDKSAEFQNHLIRGNPALYRAVFCGHEIPRDSFGPIRMANFHPEVTFIEGRAPTSLDAMRMLFHTPLKSHRHFYKEMGMDNLENSQFISDLHSPEELHDISMSINQMFAFEVTSFLLCHGDKDDVCYPHEIGLTEDRFFIARFSTDRSRNDNWIGIDLMTLPLRYAMRMWGKQSQERRVFS